MEKYNGPRTQEAPSAAADRELRTGTHGSPPQGCRGHVYDGDAFPACRSVPSAHLPTSLRNGVPRTPEIQSSLQGPNDNPLARRDRTRPLRTLLQSERPHRDVPDHNLTERLGVR